MKRRLDPWVLLMDWGLILLAVYGAVFCLADSFGVTPPTDLLWTGAALCLVFCLLFRLEHGGYYALGVLGLLLATAVLARKPLLAGALRLWQEIAGHYIRAYAWISEFYIESKEPASLLPGLWAVVILQLYVCAVSLSHFKRALPCALAVLLTLGACFVLLDTPPTVLPFALTVFALLVMVLSQNVRRRLERETAPAIVWSCAAAALLLAVICAVWPYEDYTPPVGWEDLARQMDQVGQRLENRANITAGLSGNPSKVDLQRLPWLPSENMTELYVTDSQSRYLYLRGMAYNDFDGRVWKLDTAESWEPNCLFPALELGEESTSRVSIRTEALHDVIYTPYDLTGSLPKDSRVVSDAYVANRGRLKEYTLRMLDLRPRGDVGYGIWVEENCLSVPDQTRQAVLAWWETHGVLSPEEIQAYNPLAAARTVALAVSGVASYSRRPDHTPSDRDFCDWFLNEAESGYCVHYATVTVALLRSLGIPARYATGYVCQTQANRAVEVTGLQAHAWPEVFYLGNWVPVEPTPATATEFSGEVPAIVEPDTAERPEYTRPTYEPSVPETSEPEIEKPNRPTEPRTPTDPTDATEHVPGADQSPSEPEAEPFRLPTWLWYPLGAAALAALLWLRRRLALRRFAARLQTAAPNERAALIWRRYVRLCRLSKTSPDPASEALAKKAAFSQYELSDRELASLRERLDRQCSRLAASRWYQKLWYRYGLAVI